MNVIATPDTLRSEVSKLGGVAERMLSDALDAVERPSHHFTASTPVSAGRRHPPFGSHPSLDAPCQSPHGFLATLRIGRDLDHIIALAQKIARNAGNLEAARKSPQAVAGLRHMGMLAATALKDVLDAYAQSDAALALQVWQRDIDLDFLESSVHGNVIDFMREDPRNIRGSLYVLLNCKHIERIGDHATNIAESVYQLLTGQRLPLERPKTDSLLGIMPCQMLSH